MCSLDSRAHRCSGGTAFLARNSIYRWHECKDCQRTSVDGKTNHPQSKTVETINVRCTPWGLCIGPTNTLVMPLEGSGSEFSYVQDFVVIARQPSRMLTSARRRVAVVQLDSFQETEVGPICFFPKSPNVVLGLPAPCVFDNCRHDHGTSALFSNICHHVATTCHEFATTLPPFATTLPLSATIPTTGCH